MAAEQLQHTDLDACIHLKAPNICSTCQAIFQEYKPLNERGSGNPHHRNLASFIDAQENGCYLCKSLWEFVHTNYGSPEQRIQFPLEYGSFEWDTHGTIYMIARVIEDNKKTTIVRRSFSVFSSGERQVNFGIRDRSPGTALKEGIERTQKWIENCLESHTKCLKNIQPSFLPTRLLKLKEDTIRLVVTAEEEISGPYAALSYCWGENPSFPSLVASKQSRYRGLLLHELQQGMLIAELPTAFQEAIYFLKSLSNISIQYLWIDALCIIQGDHQEWLFESSRMKDVYVNCFICLALSRASQPEQSCLGVCSPSITLPFELDTAPILSNGNKCTIVSCQYYSDALYNQPLGHRAWSLQERLLPPRVLSFGLGELFWDCFECPNLCESFPDGVGIVELEELNLNAKPLPELSSMSRLQTYWLRMVEEYTQRSLTCPEKDKLVALSAIAAWWESVMDDRYIVGHFWKMLPSSLAWRSYQLDEKQTSHPRPTRRIRVVSETENGQGQIRVPSWSWASMDGSILTYQSTWGSALAVATSWSLIPDEAPEGIKNIWLPALVIRALCTEVEWANGTPRFREPGKWNDSIYRLSVKLDESNHIVEDGTIFRIAALVQRVGRWGGLVLESVEMEGKTIYKRIGYFSMLIPARHNWKDWVGDFRSMFGQNMEELTLI